ncbi:MAG TPA: hypothetical protein HPP83_11150 [Candidatus Hydrogenedentes bacterium]|nr:hypothetical protein [Candidatus Hydrogenedentota bacterium]
MANFTTEAQVREKFQLNDTTLVPSSLIEAGIDDAHDELLRFLDPVFAEGTPDDALVMGETLLAGAHLFRTLASGEAFGQKHVAIGGQRVEEGARFGTLMAVATEAEKQAWYLLEPYLADRPSREVAAATDGTPILGEET